jgi:uncharacterized protein
MELDLDRQELGQSKINISGPLDLGLGAGCPDKVDLTGHLVVQNIESRFLVSGVLQATGGAQCGRCLNDFLLHWDVPVEMMVLRDEFSEEADGVTLVILQRRGVVDLRASLRECAILTYPQSLVCREACQGLCTSCGIDRNQGTCDCANDDVDPRWDGLPD